MRSCVNFSLSLFGLKEKFSGGSNWDKWSGTFSISLSFWIFDNMHRSPTQYRQWTGRFCQVSLLDKLQLKSLYTPFLGGSETQEAFNAFRCMSHREWLFRCLYQENPSNFPGGHMTSSSSGMVTLLQNIGLEIRMTLFLPSGFYKPKKAAHSSPITQDINTTGYRGNRWETVWSCIFE